MRVVPSAQAAATARIGIFVDHGGRALGRHLDALQAAALDVQVGHRLAADLALVLEGDVGAHFLERRVEAGAQAD